VRLAQAAVATAVSSDSGVGRDLQALQAAAQAHLAVCEARCFAREMMRMPSGPEQGMQMQMTHLRPDLGHMQC
jgi:hypothetical protein